MNKIYIVADFPADFTPDFRAFKTRQAAQNYIFRLLGGDIIDAIEDSETDYIVNRVANSKIYRDEVEGFITAIETKSGNDYDYIYYEEVAIEFDS